MESRGCPVLEDDNGGDVLGDKSGESGEILDDGA